MMTITTFAEYSQASATLKTLRRKGGSSDARISLYLALLDFELNRALDASGMVSR